MASKFYDLMAAVRSPYFQPTQNIGGGTWIGVAEVPLEDTKEVDRLTKLGVREITEDQYKEAISKKAQGLSPWEEPRPVIASPAPRAEKASKPVVVERIIDPQPAAPAPPKPIGVESVKAGVKLPPQAAASVTTPPTAAPKPVSPPVAPANAVPTPAVNPPHPVAQKQAHHKP